MQPEAVTVFLGGETELEQPRQNVRTDSDAGVLDFDDQLAGLAGVHAQCQRAAAFEAFSACRALLNRLPRIWISLWRSRVSGPTAS